MKERIFEQGSIARCNRCNAKSQLPSDIEGQRENSNAYRLRDMCILECGHLDAHWVFLNDNPEETQLDNKPGHGDNGAHPQQDTTE